MNPYKIYQIKEFSRDYSYSSIRYLREHGLIDKTGIPKLPRDLWEVAYVYQTKKRPSLDWLYGYFNRGGIDGGPPEDYEGRSMTTSDIIEMPDGRLWYCDSFGWKEVEWKEENDGE